MTRCCVLHPDLREKDQRRTPALALEEAVNLSQALDLDVVNALVVPVPKPRAGMLFGKGKTEELRASIAADDVDLVIIDGKLTPIQQRNLEKEWDVKILDRTGLILEIFSERAATREGVLQVDLAHLTYQKSRLVRSWTHLERQRGGLGFIGGPGETQIESDRRALDDHIHRIKKQLKKVVKTRALHRASRAKVPYPIVALVGYTNAGKSTIFNEITGADVMAKDMLFATLDPTMRAIELPSGRKIILSDTVGFISDLPTQLISAFRATLEEVLDADLVLHVRDISHPETREQERDVSEILIDIGISDEAQKTMLEVWNKIDNLPTPDADAYRTTAEREDKCWVTSAITGEGLEALYEAMDFSLADPMQSETVCLTFAHGKQRAWLFAQGVVESEEQSEIGYSIDVLWSKKTKNQFAAMGV